ncbi:hypothetical protein SERLA73DRAFT_77524 [Serpula lacrymans var. lacrymans S7.3]|uniref:Uncharacterized protein n=1 Tax=Serpula lacrymans var. lacrymans (strain S7.3) TaxID=936435 RepID=F8QAJ7_SERL3|nr:hypothetical protein SERLA73DRAFT_77524 [Serpula lacrymans var. lacrymans S7.3]
MRVVPTINISRVKPYKGTLPGQCVGRPGPVVVTQEEFYSKNPLASRKLRGMDLNLFNSPFQPMPENLTTTSGIWSCLEVKP